MAALQKYRKACTENCVDFLNKRVHEPSSVCACSQAVTHPLVCFHVGQPVKYLSIRVSLVLVHFSKAGTSWGCGDSAPATPDRAKPNTVVWQKKRKKKKWTKSRCGDQDCGFKESGWRKSLQSFKIPRWVWMQLYTVCIQCRNSSA